jgi:exonuclease III
MERQQNSLIGNRIFVHHRIVSAVKIVEVVSDSLSYIVLRGHWCNIIVSNVHVPSEEKSDDSKGRFYEEFEQIYDHLSEYHMKILLGECNVKFGRVEIFKSTIRKESTLG